MSRRSCAIEQRGEVSSASCAHVLTFKYVAALFVCCLIVFLAISMVFFLHGREPIWAPDGLSQYVNTFIYVGDGIRDAFKSLIAGNGFALPSYAFNVGYGVDYSKAFLNPFNAISALCPTRYAEFLFIALIFLRIYLSALTFSYYCLRRGATRSSAFIGALCYAFCGQVLFAGFARHPQFINGTIMFPLLLAGADKVFERKGLGLYVVGLALLLFLSAYQAYMECLALVVYCLLNYFCSEREKSIRDFLCVVGKFLALSLLAFCIAGIALVPSIISLLSLERVTSSADKVLIPLLHDQSYYELMPGSLFMGNLGAGHGYIGSVGVISTIAFIACRKQFPKREWLMWIALGSIALLCWALPPLSSALNGFNYVTDRWIFISGFVFSYITCLAFSRIHLVELRKKAAILAASIVFLALSLVLYSFNKGLSITMVYAGVIFIASALALLYLMQVASEKITLVVVSACVIASAVFVGVNAVASSAGSAYVKIGGAYNAIMKNSSAAAMDTIKDKSNYRYSITTDSIVPKNAPLNHSSWGIDSYMSTYNQSVKNFQNELGICSDRNGNTYLGSDSRTALDLFAGAKYFVVKNAYSFRVPYSYEKIKKMERNWTIWRTDDALPICFTTRRVIDRQAYLNLSLAQRQEALLQGCIIDTGKVSGLQEYETVVPSSSLSTKSYTVQSADGATFNGDSVVANKEKATLTLAFEGESRSETYLVLNNLKTQSVASKYSISVDSKLGKHSLELGTPAYNQRSSNSNWIKNCGYSEEPLKSVTLVFSSKGTYSFDSLEIACQPIDPVISEADAMASNGAVSMDVGTNKLSATFKANDLPELALFTVAYSPGWSARVDGQPADIIKADTAFMAVQLPAGGEHVVTLEYVTPGMREGAICTLVGLLGLVVLLIMQHKRREANRAEG